ncbi:MAG: precorrin-6A synthase (deacetylating), partial [Rhodobacteraceae bacterium]|nr:precorrin-6A synthase (deacetylating) [Paracoccaceae bacterium]
MIRDLWLVGIGTGSPSHLTLEGVQALREAAVVLMPHKGDEKDALAALRRRILEASGSLARVAPFDYPERDPALPYAERVALWHDEIARRWKAAHDAVGAPGPVALMVWGDPSLYDSTLRIAARLPSKPRVRVVPGITAIQALTAAHAIPLNTINGEVRITTGRRLR